MRHLRCHWGEEDIWFHFELDPDGWVTRQIELQGPAETPIAAASLDEELRARDAGTLTEYENTYGLTSEKPLDPADLPDPEPIPPDEFERLWQHARTTLESRQKP
ncbi:hypothetical protein BLA60_26280 [Actinophytocola xinjiangensis]|uniref:Uncharacterized protein n=1 Tax=Actinophytocola xinjiangensis TaxID=485602 RepID=A0A7Z0WIM9_9PSEU|nr:hypothetical protein [Actinophytocola xinjiangensis]OLF07827.1 hypothetical protein BLA60_26280 [Actinophytocola xinjiangensis]